MCVCLYGCHDKLFHCTIQIIMNDIHIRYEDSLTIPGRVFAVGMTMESLSAQSTDDQWVSSSLS